MKQETKQKIKDGLIVGLLVGLIVGLIAGLLYGLTITFTTQLIASITSHPEFVMFDFIVSGILILIIQIVGWYFVLKSEGNSHERIKRLSNI